LRVIRSRGAVFAVLRRAAQEIVAAAAILRGAAVEKTVVGLGLHDQRAVGLLRQVGPSDRVRACDAGHERNQDRADVAGLAPPTGSPRRRIGDPFLETRVGNGRLTYFSLRHHTTRLLIVNRRS
jgi:hypothetical protein